MWGSLSAAVKNSILGGRGSPNNCAKRPLKVLVGGMVEAEIIHVEGERAIRLLPDQLPHFVDVTRLPIGRHAHHFVFALVDFKAEEMR